VSKAPKVKGRLGTFKRNGIIQVTLGGHPLYTFSNDHQKHHATGEGVNGFGGIWHVIKAAGASAPSSSTTTSTATSTSPYPGY
jgi:predicted lipoprotein with Yx(FWY)xxD motif